ncbi:hypothetical protein JCM3770_002650 [Rhodotorula araucariae]
MAPAEDRLSHNPAAPYNKFLRRSARSAQSPVSLPGSSSTPATAALAEIKALKRHDEAAPSTYKRKSSAPCPPRREESPASVWTNSSHVSRNGSHAISKRFAAVSAKCGRLVGRVQALLPSGCRAGKFRDRQFMLDVPIWSGPIPHKLHNNPTELADEDRGEPNTSTASDVHISPLVESAPLAKDNKVTYEGTGSFVASAESSHELPSGKEEVLVKNVMSTDESSGSSNYRLSSESPHASCETGGTSADEDKHILDITQELIKRLERKKREKSDKHRAAKLAVMTTKKGASSAPRSVRSGAKTKKLCPTSPMPFSIYLPSGEWKEYDPQVRDDATLPSEKTQATTFTTDVEDVPSHQGKGKARAVTPPPVPVPTKVGPVTMTPRRLIRRAHYGTPGTPIGPPRSSSSKVTLDMLNNVDTPSRKRCADDLSDESSPAKKPKNNSTSSDSPLKKSPNAKAPNLANSPPVNVWGQYAQLPATFSPNNSAAAGSSTSTTHLPCPPFPADGTVPRKAETSTSKLSNTDIARLFGECDSRDVADKLVAPSRANTSASSWTKYAGHTSSFAASFPVSELVDAASDKKRDGKGAVSSGGEHVKVAKEDSRGAEKGVSHASGASTALGSSGDDGHEPSDDESRRPRAGHAADNTPASDGEADDEDAEDKGSAGGDNGGGILSCSRRKRALRRNDVSEPGNSPSTPAEGARNRSEPASPSGGPAEHSAHSPARDQHSDDEDAAAATPPRAVVRRPRARAATRRAPAPAQTRAVVPSIRGRAAKPAPAHAAVVTARPRISQPTSREAWNEHGDMVRLTVSSAPADPGMRALFNEMVNDGLMRHAAGDWFTGRRCRASDYSSSDESDEESWASESEGSESERSGSEGSESEGRERKGGEREGGESEGSESEGSESEGSESEGSESEGSESEGSESEDEFRSSDESADGSDHANNEDRFEELGTDEEDRFEELGTDEELTLGVDAKDDRDRFEELATDDELTLGVDAKDDRDRFEELGTDDESTTYMAPPSTLDTYLRSSTPSIHTPIRKRTAPSADLAASHKKSKKRPSSAKGKGTSPSSAQKTGAKTKARKPFVADNRNLGTLDLLSDSSDDDAVEVVLPPPAAPPSAHAVPAKRVMLEEEDWMKDAGMVVDVGASSADAPVLGDGEEGTKEGGVALAEPGAQDDGPEGTANLLDAQSRLNDPAEQDPFDGCTDDEGSGMVEADASTGFTGCECGSDDEILVVSEGPTCPGCKVLLETLPKKKRASHVESCISSSASTDATPSNVGASTSTSAPQQSLFAPLSRLFSRAPPEVSSPTTYSATPDTKGKGKAPVSLLSSLPNAFTALMAGHAETKQWKAAEEADRQKGRRPKGEEKKVPFYKWIDGLEITVDAFKYGRIPGCKGYFLSHAHSDHYQQLSSSWSHGPIYASQTTINLIKLKLGVKDEWLHPLPLDTTVKVAGIDVTLIDANHCPGSVLFLFEGPHTDPKSPYSKTPNRIFRYLHCGDFRASPQHILHPCMSTPTPPSSRPPVSSAMSRRTSSQSSVVSFIDPLPGRMLKKLDAIYLDTTYLAPSYCFPAQELVITACADLVRERVVGGDEDALWRADGREAERKGMKGWLSAAPAGGGLKSESKEEDTRGEMIEMEALPEEDEMDDESQARGPRVEEDDEPEEGGEGDPGEGDGDADEEAWRAVHGDEDTQASAPGEAQPHSAEESSMQLDECAAGPAHEQLRGDHHEMVKPDVEDDKLTVSPRAVKAEPLALIVSNEGGEDVKPDVKPDIKSDFKLRKERLLVLVGTYSIGKERIVKAIAHALSTQIYCDARKRDLFLAQDDPDLHALLTDDPLAAQVHVGGLRDITREAMSDYMAKWKAPRVQGGFTKMIGLRPTGWTYRSETKDKFPSIPKILQLEQQRKFSPAGLYPQRDSTPQIMAFGVPYSEHSSFFELTCFALSLDYVRIIPTVNVHTASSRNKMKGWIDRWAAEKKRRVDARMPRIVPFRSETYW